MSTTVIRTESRLLTLGQLRDELETRGFPGLSVHQVKYAVERHRIEPVARVGIIRVWSEEAIPKVQTALDRIAEKRRA